MRREAFKNDGLPVPSIATDPFNTDYDINGVWDTTRNTDWQKETDRSYSPLYEFFKASISGGTSNTQFLIDASYKSKLPFIRAILLTKLYLSTPISTIVQQTAGSPCSFQLFISTIIIAYLILIFQLM